MSLVRSCSAQCAGRQKAKVKSKTKPKPGVRQSKSATSTELLQPAHKPVDYSRFDTIEVSDDEDGLQKVSDCYEGCGGNHMVPTIAPCLPLSSIVMCIVYTQGEQALPCCYSANEGFSRK